MKISDTSIGVVAFFSFLGFIGYLSYQKYQPLYVGPVNVSTVKRVEVNPEYFTWYVSGSQISYSTGTTINITLDDGNKVSLRDYEANFKVDPKDELTGDIPPQTLEQVLGELKQTLRSDEHILDTQKRNRKE